MLKFFRRSPGHTHKLGPLTLDKEAPEVCGFLDEKGKFFADIEERDASNKRIRLQALKEKYSKPDEINCYDHCRGYHSCYYNVDEYHMVKLALENPTKYQELVTQIQNILCKN